MVGRRQTLASTDEEEIEMRASITARSCRLALRALTALALAIVPCHLALHGCASGIAAASAYAKDSGHGGGGSGSNSGNGSSGDDHGGTANSGSGKGANGASHHVNEATGDKVDVDGSKIEVEHLDGIREEIKNGRFEMKDALGRTIVERPATANDFSRLRAL
ncbi:hypothetical protein [Mesorhizobium sp.]|uniref:hypothetical protein n=1 Tax=Mesorhizobium sp. TaxID=1871066 RepID=UPI0025B7F1F1|nr:hypothetical protein [Mesorhizobium sp.]